LSECFAECFLDYEYHIEAALLNHPNKIARNIGSDSLLVGRQSDRDYSADAQSADGSQIKARESLQPVNAV